MIFIYITAVFFIFWLGIWIDTKRAKVHMEEEGWTKEGPGMVKRPRNRNHKAKVIKLDEFEEITYHDLEPIQNN
jgi:hypothetical protein